MEMLERDFFRMPTLLLAERLLGKIFVLRARKDAPVLKGMIVETEAYLAENDEACHAWRGMTKRNSAMFGPPGTLYVYFSYGNHHLMNIVSEPEGTAGAVLIRAMEPLEGIPLMKERRNTTVETGLMSGPGRLTQALGIDLSYCGKALFDKRCHIEDAPDVPARMIGTSSRIGISKSTGLPWRKYVIGNPHVSKAFFTHPITASSHDRDPNLT